jgi:hypothetical protein
MAQAHQQIGQITLDNASNNDTMMWHLEGELCGLGCYVSLKEEIRCQYVLIISLAILAEHGVSGVSLTLPISLSKLPSRP